MTTAEIIGLALKIIATVLGWYFEKDQTKKAQKAETVKAIDAALSEIKEAINEGNESAFNCALNRLRGAGR